MINAALLFVVLFYVYPLKFLFGLFIGQVVGTVAQNQLTAHQGVELMVVYGLGFMAIYLLFAALYWNGWKQRETLQLTPLELRLTKIYIQDHLLSASVGLLSCLLAVTLPGNLSGMAGFAYMLIGATKSMTGARTGRAERSMRGTAGRMNPATC